MRRTQVIAWAVAALALSQPIAQDSSAREFSFVLRICEAPEFKVLINDQIKASWSDCDIPVPQVPVFAFTDGGDRMEAKIDDHGIAKIATIQLGPTEKARLMMACTTHRCLSLHGLFPGGVFRHGENRILVYTRKRETTKNGSSSN